MHARVRRVFLIAMVVLGGITPLEPAAAAGADAVPPEVLADWREQDGVGPEHPYPRAITGILAELGARGADLRLATESLDGVLPADPRWSELYLQACAERRAARVAALLATTPRIIFTKHYDLGGSFYAYTEGQSDAQHERHFVPGASLCLLTLDGLFGRVETLLDDPGGVIRDPSVSWDGCRVLFAWKKSDLEDDYHLYEMEVASRAVRQLTDGLGFADYEGVYAPNGDIIFSSTRCVQTVDCWWTEVSNLYTCDGDGRYLRRLTFDQVHDNYPTIAPDGRVLYTRWDYNDRGQMFPQGLFQMAPDGTGQTEVYGNNSWFPTSILHARAMPGSGRIVAVFSGHHTIQKGWLGILDPAKGRQENAGAQLIAPIRETEAVRVDYYGQDGDQFQYPYPLSETEFLVALKPARRQSPFRQGREQGEAPGSEPAPEMPFGIYWIDVNGRRELLAWAATISCNQPAPLVARDVPHARPSTVDYRQSDGIYYMQDVYAGAGLSGIPRGTVKKLRVVALEFRAAGIGHNCSQGPAGEALACTPVSIGNGSWDTKTVLGEATVHEDGSAMFAVPAGTPAYFQAVDDRGYVVQTMRSWSTLQPGERMACVGCHESKNSAPPAAKGVSAAMKAGVEELDGFYGPPRGFSFRGEIQPILDRHCIRCHHVKQPSSDGAGITTDGSDDPLERPPSQEERRAPRTHRPPSQGGLQGGPASVDGTDRPPSQGGPQGGLAPAGDTDPPPAVSLAQKGATAGRHEAQVEPAFSLLGDEVLDPSAKRLWSESYLALTNAGPQTTLDCANALAGHPNEVVNWISAQSEPSMLPPYSAGAARSRLMTLLEEGHGGVQLSREERDKIACWIDLLVPFCGDYLEANAWSDEELAKYQHFEAKRERMTEQEVRNIEAWLDAQERRNRPVRPERDMRPGLPMRGRPPGPPMRGRPPGPRFTR